MDFSVTNASPLALLVSAIVVLGTTVFVLAVYIRGLHSRQISRETANTLKMTEALLKSSNAMEKFFNLVRETKKIQKENNHQLKTIIQHNGNSAKSTRRKRRSS